MNYNLIHGNSLEVLKTLEENSIDSIVTDPPYEIGFMNKKWDSTGIAFNVEIWKECLRVLKPGGHLIAFSGSRTYHRMAVAIEDAGFQIRDQIMWVYGSGFPKSLDISKAIDKAKPKNKDEISKSIINSGLSDSYIAGKLDVSSALVRFWRLGDRTIQKEECEKLNKLLELELEYTEDKREVVGINENAMSGWNTNGKIKFIDRPILKGTTELAKQWQGWGTALKPSHEPMVLARKPLSENTVAENVLKYGTGGINIDGCRVGSDGATKKINTENCRDSLGKYGDGLNGGTVEKIDGLGRWPANFIHDGSLEQEWDRFFYCAKASKKDRNDGLINNNKEILSWESVDLNVELMELNQLQKDISEDILQNLENKEWNILFSGKENLEQYQMDTKFIIKMVLSMIIELKTLNVSNHLNIKESILTAIRMTMENGLNLAVIVENLNQLKQNITNEKMVLVLGVSLAVLKMLQGIKEKGKQGNIHSTVKPTDLMAYLVRLVTQPGGIVLDPFNGSGSTGKACMREGFNYIGIDLSQEYLDISKARIEYELNKKIT